LDEQRNTQRLKYQVASACKKTLESLLAVRFRRTGHERDRVPVAGVPNWQVDLKSAGGAGDEPGTV
jgi:hypothetical protein